MTDIHYKQFVDIYGRLQERGFEILAFPCNQFGSQEPGTNADIKQFAAGYGAKFPLFAKIKVNGEDAHPIWKFLRAKLTGVLGSSIKWNFTKFLLNKQGVPIKRFSPPTKPLSFESQIIELLEQ